MPRRNKHVPLTPKEQAFVDNFQGNASEAAQKAGYKQPQVGYRLLKRKRVLDAIAERREELTAVRIETIRQGVKITRNDIINRLDTISTSAESEATRVAALRELKDIFGLSPKHADTDLFAGWTDEELDYYRNSGGQIPPSRNGSTVGSGESDAGTPVPAQR